LDWAAAVRALVVDDSRAVDEKEAMGARKFVILASDDRLRIARRRWRLLDRLALVFVVVFVVIVASSDAVLQDRIEVGFNVVFVFVVVIVGTRASGSGDVVFVVVVVVFFGRLGALFGAFELVFFAVELLAVRVVLVASGSCFGLVVFWGIFVSHRFLRL
jgi:hypothetical protein